MKVYMNREEKLGKGHVVVDRPEEADVVCVVPDPGYETALLVAADYELPTVVLSARDRKLRERALELGFPEKAIFVEKQNEIVCLDETPGLRYPIVRGGIRVKDLIPLLERAVRERWVAEPVVKLIDGDVVRVVDEAEPEPEKVPDAPDTDIIAELFGEQANVFAVIPNAGVDTARIAAAMARALSGVRVEASAEKRGPVAGEPYIHFDGNRLTGDQHELAVAETIVLEVRMPELIDALLGSKKARFVFVSGSDFRSHQTAASFIAQWTSVGGRLDAVFLIGDRDDNIAGTIKHRFPDIPIVRGIDGEHDLEEAIRELEVPAAG
ncbi:hypothetical protein [Hydrogenibacillus schlegelii]|nr:hypothetical protein [Hydrogenibacillus schlegelii]